MTPRCGLVLLTGGRGERLSGTKHDRPHPGGGSWGGHLVRVFRTAVAEGQVCVIGAPLPEHPDLPRVEDPREGPAIALKAWAASAPPSAQRWWVVACDQVRWTPEAFAGWLAEAEAADPDGAAWILVFRDGHRQPLGGFVGGALVPALASIPARSLRGFLERVPVLEAISASWAGEDIDTPEELDAFTRPPAHPARL